MNEQALQDAYNLFVQQGYKKSIDDFKTLISTNPDALNDSYNLFASQGYRKSVDDYKALLGVGAPMAAPKVEAPLKKKAQVPTVLPSEDSFLASQSQLPSFETTPLKDITREQAVATAKAEKKKFVPAMANDDIEGQQSYWDNFATRALSGVTSADKFIASIPEAVIDVISIPQNAIAAATGWDIAGNAETFKKQFGISNPILDKLNEEEKRLKEKTATFNKARYESLGIVDNIQKGNYQDAFELLGSSIVESAPTSILMMMGGATLAPTELVGAGTLGFLEQNREQLGEENPDMSEIEKTVKALGMAASETVFESVGTGTLGQVYKDIITKEGVEAGKNIFRDGLVQMYKGALKKYGAPIGLVGEGIEEAATQITQNVISGKPAFEGAADAFVTGAGSGVVFSTPINAIKAKQYVSNTIDTYKSKNKIADVLKDTDINLDQVYNVPKDAAITPQQLEIANTNKSRDILSKDLSKKVKSGEISEVDAKQSLYVFDKVQQVSNAVKDLDVDADTKANIATLLRKRVELTTKIQNMDDALVVKEKQDIQNINKQIEDIILNAKPAETIKTEEDAIQEQATDEGVLRSQQPEVGLQEVGKGNVQPEVIATGTEETITPESTQEVSQFIIEPTERTSWSKNNKEYKVGDIIDGNQLDELSGNLVGNIPNEKFILVQEPLSKFDDTREKLLAQEQGYEQEEIDRLESMKANFDKTPPLPNEGDGMHRIISAKELGNKTILMWKNVKDVLPQVSSKTQPTEVKAEVSKAPKLVRDVSVLITPATVREASPVTKRIKDLSVKYDKLVKQFSKKKSKKTLDKIKEAEAQILNDAKQEIIDEVSKIDGVAVKFSDPKRGLWDGSFEPAFNMTLSISPQANTEAVSKLLFDFAEKYSQDAFILETDSEYEADVFSGNREVPLTEFDENNLMHYPQIIYTFDVPITDEQVADLSNELEKNGVDAFNINNNEIKVSVIKFFNEDEQQNLTEDEQYEERTRDLDSKSIATEKATVDVLGPNVKVKPTIRIKKSSYQGAKNEGTSDQTREFDRSDVLKSFKESTTKVEELAVELEDLRQKQIKLQANGEQLSPQDQARFNELNKTVQPAVQRTFEANKPLYEQAKQEVEKIASDAIEGLNASLSPFPIKKPERASVKAIRWYGSFTEKLGDGARVNVVVDSDANADKVFEAIDTKYPSDNETRRIKEDTELGYPKRLIEIKTSNGTIAEIQVITNEAYLAKDGLKGFTGDQKQKDNAKKALDQIRKRLGFNIPDGLGHYFYEINRDVNVDEELRAEAARLSDLYYDAFTNPESTLNESFMKDVLAFKENVDAADKTNWDTGNTGKAPSSLTEYTPTKEAKLIIEEEVFKPITISDVKTPAFTRENAMFYDEDERETDSGRTSTYLSSVTVEATDPDGEQIGTITKITDEDKIFYFKAEDAEGGELNLDGFDTLGEAKKAIADAYNKAQKKEFDKAAKKKAKQKEKAAAKKVKAEPTVEEQVTGLVDDLLQLDPKDKTTTQKVQAGLDKLIKDIDKFEKENLGVNIALPVIKTILKAIKVLVDAGVSLEQAIKQAAKDNNVAVRDVVDGINAVNNIAPIQAEYDALMTKADALIARQKRRGIDDAKIVSNLDTMIRNSDVYKNANDAQKKIMEREARNKMGVGPKRAVSIGRVLGALKDITNISRSEKMKVIKQIRDLSRDAAKELAKEIKDMATKGTITTKQAANIIARFGKVNMLNEISVSNFVDYMAKVFSNAEYANKIDVAKSKLKAARKNIATKIGIADGLMLPLQRLFSINPTLIPDQYLERYLELVDMFGARQAVLTLEQKQDVTKDVQAILDEIDNERSKADELADRLNSSKNKVYENDELDYAASVKKMLDEKEIDEKEAETMRKYKEDIAPQVEETELTDEEAEQEKKELIAAVDKSSVDSSELPSKYEREKARELAKLIKTDAVDGLTNTELKNLLKVIDNINNNYFPHYAQLMIEKLNSINRGKVVDNSINKAKPAKFSTLYARAKAFVAKTGRTGISELIRRNPLYYIDQLFGDYNTKDIFNSILAPAADAEALFKADLKKVQNILENAEEKVAKSFKLDANKTLMSKFKMMTYMVQLEYESNKGSKQVNPAADYLKATIKHIDDGKSEFGDRDAEMLQEILDTYTDADGNIDNEKLYNSFNQAEKDAIKDIRGVNESLADKAQQTAAIIRGERITPLNNYIHLNVLHEHQPNDLTTGTAFRDEYNNSMRPSTKAKSLIARTGKVSPINFDVFASAQRGAKFVLMDFNLTEPIRTARRTLNQALANLEKNGRVPKEKRQIFNAINSAFEEAVENLLTNAYISDTLVDEAINYVNKQGYRAILAGTGRFVSELSSNIGFAMLADPKGFIEGVKNRGFIMSVDAPLVMENVKSKQTTRIFPTDTLAGRLIDTSILSQASGIKGAKSKNPVANKIQQIYNLTGKKYVNTVELIADGLISTPDKMVMRPMWFGAFANEFKAVTGKDVNFEKIAANDEEYMSDNKEAIEKAKDVADQRSVMAGATDNPFMGVLKGTVKPNQSLLLRGFNNFNNFMTKFLIFEYVTARTAINAAIGNGSLSKKQGAAVLGAVATRMIVYTLLTTALGTGLIGLVFGDDDEPETEKSWLQKLGQALTSTLTSLTIGRDFGNATKSILNYGVERANEKYLDFLREGEYDPYKDALQYSIVPPEKKGRQTDLKDFLLNMGGSFGPALKTADFVVKKAFEPEKKEADAIERQKKEIGIRIPLEILGNAGLIPLYKDVRKEVMKQLYKDLEVAQENAGDKSQAKKEKLQGYETEGDMKRYDPELWNRTFGPDAPDYDVRQAEKALKKTQDSLERAMKDEMYDYVPRKKNKAGGIKKLY